MAEKSAPIPFRSRRFDTFAVSAWGGRTALLCDLSAATISLYRSGFEQYAPDLFDRFGLFLHRAAGAHHQFADRLVPVRDLIDNDPIVTF